LDSILGRTANLVFGHNIKTKISCQQNLIQALFSSRRRESNPRKENTKFPVRHQTTGLR
jgi:hypothetical protein